MFHFNDLLNEIFYITEVQYQNEEETKKISNQTEIKSLPGNWEEVEENLKKASFQFCKAIWNPLISKSQFDTKICCT